MRISCPGFARVRDADGKYAILLNEGLYRRGFGRILSPIGGALEFYPSARLAETFGASHFEQGNDLRFRVDDTRVNDVVAWFLRRSDRETSSLREFREELVDVGVLKPSHMKGIQERFVRYIRYDTVTRRNVPEKETAYLIEVFDVTISEAALETLHEAAAYTDPYVYFAREDEIRRGAMDDGTVIGEITQKML
ncbi:MAG TPA: hypothetical protein VJ841_02680 [Candidatus Saccharimonadales bacterium]|nr:hypothetical protein [Candidatus Saccharimonadales bacterium]